MDPTFSHRFLGVHPSSAFATAAVGDELNEDDILWTSNNDSSPGQNNTIQTPTAAAAIDHGPDRRASFLGKSGILAALPDSSTHSILYRKPSLPSASKAIPAAIPRPPPGEREFPASQSVPVRKMNQSAPMNVPVLSMAMAKQRNSKFREEYWDDDDDGDGEMLPPHEIVALGSRRSPKTTFSVLEGVGRTLKGRDLRQVRNAVFRQTGFLD